MTAKKTTVRLDITAQERELIEKWMDLLGFKSQRETVKFLTFLGTMSLEMVGGHELDAANFANALYTVGSRFFQGEFSPNIEAKVREFKQWRENNLGETATSTVSYPLQQI